MSIADYMVTVFVVVKLLIVTTVSSTGAGRRVKRSAYVRSAMNFRNAS